MIDPGWMTVPGLALRSVRSSLGRRPDTHRRRGGRRGAIAASGIFLVLAAVSCGGGSGGGGGSPGSGGGANAVGTTKAAAGPESADAALLRTAPFVAAFLLSAGAEFRRIAVAESAQEAPYRSVLTTGASLVERVSGRRVTSRSNPISAVDLDSLRERLRRLSTFRLVAPPAVFREWNLGMATAGEDVFLLMQHQGGGKILLLRGPDEALEFDLDAASGTAWSDFWRATGG